MLGRVGVLVALAAPALLRTLAVPLVAMMVASLVGLLLTFRRSDGEETALELENPFELGSAVKVTLMFGVVLLATKAATVYLGDQGLYLTSALAGTTDVDAITLSSARLANDASIAAIVATVAIVIAVAANTIVKTALAGGIGGWGLGRRVALVGALVIAAGGIALGAAAIA
jgi:uncharacterized membrane protein (DUF4010 family)